MTLKYKSKSGATNAKRAGERNPLIALAASKGFTLQQLAKRCHTAPTQFSPSNLNHTSISAKVFSRLANVLNVPLSELEPMSREGMGLQSKYHHLKKKLHRTKKPGTSLVRIKQDKRSGAITLHAGNGKQRHKRIYGRMHTAPRNVQQIVATTFNTVNLAVMKGEEATPPMPTADLYAMLQFFADEMGIRINVLVDPDYHEAFGG